MTLRRILIVLVLFGTFSPVRSQGRGVGIRINLTETLQLNQGTSGQFAQLFVPDYYCVPPDGGVILVVHFHSASWAAEDEIYRSRANAILLNIHLGSFSTPYRVFFNDPRRFQAILDTVVVILSTRSIVPFATVKTLILTSFSAGYGGVREILRRASYYSQVDALLLADGLHADLDSSCMVAQMADFTRFACDARDRMKVFLLTHSSIATSGYRSTTQTADYLLHALGARPRAVEASDEIGLQISACDTGCFRVRGYAGAAAPDHMRHLYSMHRMVSEALAMLRDETPEREKVGGRYPAEPHSLTGPCREFSHRRGAHATTR
jgi:hypothetical protein